MAVETDCGLLVIHAMPMRAKYAPYLEEADDAGRQSHPRHAKTGTPITDQLADQLAEEAEVGYDFSIARRVGRRSLAGGAGASPRVNFRMTSELYEHARACAEREGKTVSELARDALVAYVER